MTDIEAGVAGWSCDEKHRDRGECRNSHGCHCAEITSQAERIKALEAKPLIEGGGVAEATVERVAKAIYETDPDSGYNEDDPAMFWRASTWRKEVWDEWHKIARAAIRALTPGDTK